jgi:hypothetical protein
MRIIQSPGVQITEKDLSLRANLPIGTTCLVIGFAPQGPVNEPLIITSASELEAVFGIPTSPAERYFYYSCREVLNSPGVLAALRLPYGDNKGSDFSAGTTGLFYPMASGIRPEVTGLDPVTGSTIVISPAVVEWQVGAPRAFTFTEEQYEMFKTAGIPWGNTSVNPTLDSDPITGLNMVVNPGSSQWNAVYEIDPTTGLPAVDSNGRKIVIDVGTIDAGFVVFNDIQSNINELAEGHYIGFADNLATLSSTSPDFDSIRAMNTFIGADPIDGTPIQADIPENRLDFQLDTTKLESERGITSISESLEKVGFVGYETERYQDHVSLGIFKIRRSTADPALLTLGRSEKYIGSFDYNRRQVSPNGGLLSNAFVEDLINSNSPTVKMFINPIISKQFDWTSNGSPFPTARFTVHESAKVLMPLGIYSPDTRAAENSKRIGNVQFKLDRALRPLECVDDIQIDVITDCGLSTIFANTETNKDIAFDDEKFVAKPDNKDLLQNWKAITTTLINFAQNVRKDCVAIIDPLRQTFVNGRDAKIAELKSKDFTSDIYKPLREQSAFESNYAAMYGNWIKIMDMFTSRRFWMPFSGYASAIFARNDAVAQPWSAPAGLTRGVFNALDIAFNPNQKQRDRLYEISVNPVVFFNGDGHVVMGQKTLQTRPSAFDRINVRRLFLYLERATQRTLKYFVFEPNTDFTRSRLVAVITPIFEMAKQTEGLYDYLIVADQRNNTPDTIDQNELIVDIYIKPVRTAEFILVNFIATRTGQDFQELI